MNTTSKRQPPLRKADIERATKGVMNAGLTITRIEVGGGTFVIHTSERPAHQESPLEAWRRKDGQG